MSTGRLIRTLGRIDPPKERIYQSGRVYGTDSGRVVDPQSPLYYATQYGLLTWGVSYLGITFGATPRASGTSPPVATLGGTLTSQQIGLRLIIDAIGTGAIGSTTLKASLDNGSTYTVTGIATSAVAVAITGTTLTIAFSGGGTFSADNQYDATVSQMDDQSGLGNHWTQSTASRQPLFTIAGYGGVSAIDQTSAGTLGMETPNLTMGIHTIAMATFGTNGGTAGFIAVQNNDGTSGYLYSANGPSSQIVRGGNASRREVSATWARDGVRKTIARTLGGTHGDHRIFVQGSNANATSGGLTADPGFATVTGPLYLGNRQTYDSGGRLMFREIAAFANPLPPQAIMDLHVGMVLRSSGAISL